jgi:hypothetical protein
VTLHSPERRAGRSKLGPILEWAVIILCSLAIAFGLIAVLSGFFAAQDQAGVSGSGTVPGLTFRDVGHVHLAPGAPHPAYSSSPPTSGAHVPLPVTADESELNNDQLLEALELGDVVLMYGSATPPPGLRSLADSVGGPFSSALAASGEAVILARRPGITGVTGLAWTHLVRVAGASDPLLRAFAQYWLGRGAPGR